MMLPRRVLGLAVSCLLAAAASTQAQVSPARAAADGFQQTFAVDKAELGSTGRNPYFILEAGYQHTYEGMEGKQTVRLIITVLSKSEMVDGVETRVVEERETADGKLVKISRNFFAISKKTRDVYYFGEDVDNYSEGKVVSHKGSWRAGVAGARFGLFMPAQPVVGARYYQEQAPGVALDRFEIQSVTDTLQTPAGRFTGVVRCLETTPLEPGVKAPKQFASGVGLIKDGSLLLVKHGMAVPAGH